MKNNLEEFNCIYAYTRADALANGVLKDVTKMAHEAGFSSHVETIAVTKALWDMIENIPEEHSYQDVEGRLWDVLCMGVFSVKEKIRKGNSGSQLVYNLIMHHNAVSQNVGAVVEEAQVKLVCHSGDVGEFAMTLMLPNED